MYLIAVHIVGTGMGVVSQTDAKVFDFQGLFLLDFFNADNLADGLLEMITERTVNNMINHNV